MAEEDGRLRRRKEALQVFSEQPNYFSREVQEAILSNRVILGMTPYDVHLAVGAFAFKVVADKSKWPDGANPWDVMWAQTQHPDQSEIWLTFESDIQLPDQPGQNFRVYIKGGKAQTIEHLKPEVKPEPKPESKPES